MGCDHSQPMGKQIIPICAQQMMIAREPLGAHIGGDARVLPDSVHHLP
jgi:hypothetical protein